MTLRFGLLFCLLVALCACGNTDNNYIFAVDVPGDMGPVDTGTADAGNPVDAGNFTDAVTTDNGPVDSGGMDAVMDTGSDVTCADGGTACRGFCVNTSTDPHNCGVCGNACSGSQLCRVGTCVANPCPHNQYPCDAGEAGTICTDTTSDPTNCGGCGVVCGTGMECSAGACFAHCTASQTRCAGVCTTVATDPMNCGTCGHACGTGQTCVSNTCTCAAPLMACGGACVTVATDSLNCGRCGNVCGAGTYCSGGACVGCPSPRTLCAGGLCTNTGTDAMNCGTCGHACPRGNTCVAGSCLCPSTSATCSGVCSDLQTDTMNCGTCGHACPSPMTCRAGACSALVLYHGWVSPVPGCITTSYNTTAPTNLGGTYPFNTGDSNACRAWKLAATVCTTMPMMYTDIGDWSCPVSGGFTDPMFGTYCMVANQYSCSGCPGACNASCEFNPLSLRNCAGVEANQM